MCISKFLLSICKTGLMSVLHKIVLEIEWSVHTRGSVVGLIHPVILVSLTEEPRQGCSVTHETYVICPPPAPCASLAPRALGAVALCPAPWDLHPVPCAGGILMLATHTSSCLNSPTRTLSSCTALVLVSTVPRGFTCSLCCFARGEGLCSVPRVPCS